MDRQLGRFFSYGTNHRHAPLCFRESLYLSPDQVAYILPQIKAHHRLPELAILSTCNRLEMYGVSQEPETDRSKMLLHIFRDLQIFAQKAQFKDIREIEAHTFCHTGKQAVQHVFDVAASVDSLIVGETQITGQFKDAFTIAHRACTLGPHLHHLSQNALRIAKKVRSETVIGQKTVSIGHAAIDLSRKIFSDLTEKNLLLLGAGDIAQVTGLYAKKLGIRNISVLNRSLDRAQDLIGVLGTGKAGLLSELTHFLSDADIVITALRSEKPVLTPSLLKVALSKRRNKPMYIVDIAIPRNVDSNCGKFENVYLFELDDLKNYVDENLSERESAAKEAKAIIDVSLERFCRRVSELPESYVISKFQQYVESVIAQESKRTLSRSELSGLSNFQRESLQRLFSSMTQKFTAHFAIAMKNVDTSRKDHFKEVVHEITKTHSLPES